MSDDSSITGKGSEILLPKSGNPFKRSGGGQEAPRDLTPDEVAARFGKAAPQADSTSDLPADLSPADVAALFPSTQEERNAIPAGSPESNAASAQPFFPPPPPRQTLAAKTDVDLKAFDPDAPIGDAPSVFGKADLPPTLVDIGTFNPDAPVGTDIDSFMPTDTSMADATSVKADAMPESETPPAFPTGLSIGTLSVDTASSPAGGVTIGAMPTAPSSPASQPPTPSIKIDGSVVKVDSLQVEASPAAPTEILVPDDVLTEAMRPEKDLPTVPVNTLHLPLKEDAALLQQLVTDDLIQRLWRRIDEAERHAIQDDSSLPPQRATNLNNLRTARNIILGGQENYEDALRYVAEVETDLLYAQRVRRWSYTYGTAVLFYNVAWILALAFGYSYTLRISATYSDVVPQAVALAIWVTLLAGGLGGVSKSLFSLYTHVSKGDFDRQYLHWYIVSPITGAVLGVFVYVVAQMGLAGIAAATQMGMSSVNGGTVELAPSATGGFIMYGLAWVVGFQQNLVLRLVDRVVKLVFGTEEEKQESRRQKPSAADKS